MEAEALNPSPPALVPFSGHTDDWELYQESLFKIFQETLIDAPLRFMGMPVRLRRFPEEKGKHFTFWHLISEGETEAERIPDLRRCERIRWTSWVIAGCGLNPDITYWQSRRKRSDNFVLWLEKAQFAVILAQRKGYFMLLTAYPVTEKRRIASFIREREEYRKTLKKS